MRTRWLDSLILSLGLTSLGFAGCTGDDGGNAENVDEAGDGDTTTTTTDTTGDGDTPCTPGELGCECSNGLCLGDLVCVGGVCIEDGGMTTDTTDTGMECPNANEMLCDGVCVDVMSDNSNCGGCGNECHVTLEVGECVDGTCAPTYSDCVDAVDPTPSCPEVCQMQGFAGCAGCGPNAITVRWYSTPLGCENDSTVVTGGLMCESQPEQGSPYDAYRCCCEQ